MARAADVAARRCRGTAELAAQRPSLERRRWGCWLGCPLFCFLAALRPRAWLRMRGKWERELGGPGLAGFNAWHRGMTNQHTTLAQACTLECSFPARHLTPAVLRATPQLAHDASHAGCVSGPKRSVAATSGSPHGRHPRSYSLCRLLKTGQFSHILCEWP